MTEHLFLLEPDITVLRPVVIEGSHRRHGVWSPKYWNCSCGKTLHHGQVIKHLGQYHFYTQSQALFVFRQAKLGKPQYMPTLVNLLANTEGSREVSDV